MRRRVDENKVPGRKWKSNRNTETNFTARKPYIAPGIERKYYGPERDNKRMSQDYRNTRPPERRVNERHRVEVNIIESNSENTTGRSINGNILGNQAEENRTLTLDEESDQGNE